MKTRLVINGAHGRMGHALIENAKQNPDAEVVGEVDIDHNLTNFVANSDVVIDFTHPSTTASVLETCLKAGKALVIGTTGQDDSVRTAIAKAATTIPIVFSPNFSVGVNALFWLTQKACNIMGNDFDLEVIEMHHRLKQDAPSGTARRLAEILAEERQLSYEKDVRHGREGIIGPRSTTEIGMHALRGGDVVGDHTVVFAGIGERLELTHKASSRDTFAKGAIRAALWVAQKPPGLYDMQDVLELK